MQLQHLRLAFLVLLAFADPSLHGQSVPADGCPRTLYFSTGDNQDLLIWFPLDSRATIEATFDTVRQRYRADRIWWRGGQDTIWGREFVYRPENREFERLGNWWKDLAYRKVGTNRIAVKAAHDRGLSLWLTSSLFENGSGPDVGFTGFPYAAEDRLRVEHPEWVPVNRYGTWCQGGPIAFCYPGARKWMMDYLKKYVLDGGYDGLALLTYCENYSLRYQDEFGYNQPVVDEFKKRHGVDIRRQPFDRAAWARLQGEYVTQFLRELHAALAAHGKKIAVTVDGNDPHLPWVWNTTKTRPAGRIHLDVETWVKEGIVDEVCLGPSGDDTPIRSLDALCRGKSSAVSVWRTRGEMPIKAPRILFVGQEVESGFDYEDYIGFKDEKLTPQPASALTSDDAFARRRLISAVAAKKQTLPLRDVMAAVKDRDVFVRRIALRALGALQDPAAVPAVEAALGDPENSVRCQTALVLAEFPSPAVVTRLMEAAARPDSAFQFSYRAVLEALKAMRARGKLGPREKEPIVACLGDSEPRVREIALHCLYWLGAPATPAVEDALRKVLREDASPLKELAIENLRSSFGGTPAVRAALAEAMRGPDAVVQMRAATALATIGRGEDKPARARALEQAVTFFRRYGDGCERPDAAWGWREFGNAILAYGPEGRTALEGLMKQKQDQRLADLAWRVVYLRQGDVYQPVTEAEDKEAHARYPFPEKLATREPAK